MNPSWEYRLWTEANLPRDFINQHHIESMARNQPDYSEAGQADIMRYELLYRYGGFFVDADSEFVNPLEDFMTRNDSFCCYESEVYRGDLLANGYLAASAQNELMQILIQALKNKPTVVDQLPWIATGPLFFTQTVERFRYSRLKIYPSHYFIPRHFSNTKMYNGPGKIYCIQHWGSTLASTREKYLAAVEYNAKGEQLYAAGHPQEAEKQFKRAIEAGADLAAAHNNLSVLYWQAEQSAKALMHLAEALRIDPHNKDVRANLSAMQGQI